MVKITFLIASVAALFLTVNAQTPDELHDIAKSILANPGAFQSQIASLSQAASSLPTEYKGQVNSILAGASKTLDQIAKPTGKSAGNPTNKPVKYMAGIAAAGAAVAVGLLA